MRKAPKTQSIVRPLDNKLLQRELHCRGRIVDLFEAAFNLAPAEGSMRWRSISAATITRGGDADHQQHSRSSISLPLAIRTLCTLCRSRLCDAKNSARPSEGVEAWTFGDGQWVARTDACGLPAASDQPAPSAASPRPWRNTPATEKHKSRSFVTSSSDEQTEPSGSSSQRPPGSSSRGLLTTDASGSMGRTLKITASAGCKATIAAMQAK